MAQPKKKFGTAKTKKYISNTQSRFALVVLDSVLGPPRITKAQQMVSLFFGFSGNNTKGIDEGS